MRTIVAPSLILFAIVNGFVPPLEAQQVIDTAFRAPVGSYQPQKAVHG